MTPLAHRIVKELTLPVKDRVYPDCNAAQRLSGVHCFEVSDVSEMASILGQKMLKYGVPEHVSSFLPAPKTWIEARSFPFRGLHGKALAFLLESESTGDCRIQVFTESGSSEPALFNLSKCSGISASVLAESGSYAGTPAVLETAWLWAILAIINSPRLIGRQQHMPHRGLERRLANAKAVVGKFPLHAWTELKLRVSDIGKRADGTEYEAHYTGKKCLHFCRAHLRIQNGKVVFVNAHWRGDGALGIKQTRYKLAA